jgi:hypothetical protein
VASALNNKVQNDGNGDGTVVVQEPYATEDDATVTDDDPGTDNGNTGPEEETPAEDGPVLAYACIDMVYDDHGTETDYYSEFNAVYGDGSYTIKIARSDEKIISTVFDKLSYMTIKLLRDNEEADISKAVISDIKVSCDGVPVSVTDNETVSLSEDVSLVEIDKAENETYDFGEMDEIEISFTVSGVITGLKNP